MGIKIALWWVWAGFVLYVLFLAPPVQASTIALFKKLITAQWLNINPVIFSLFSLVGIWLLIYTCLMLADGRMQKIPAWPFLIASTATGVIGLTPYLALRQPNRDFTGKKDTILKIFDSRWTGIILSLNTILFLGYALLFGDWLLYIYQFQTSRFVNGMSIAFCLFYLLFPTLLEDDMARRKLPNPLIFWAVSLVPLIGPLVYLCLRPELIESSPKY